MNRNIKWFCVDLGMPAVDLPPPFLCRELNPGQKLVRPLCGAAAKLRIVSGAGELLAPDARVGEIQRIPLSAGNTYELGEMFSLSLVSENGMTFALYEGK